MAYVQVPKDLTRVKTKVIFNLTKRQLICFGLAGVTGVPFYLLTKGVFGTTISACLMVVLVLPFFFFAMYEKDERPLEKILMNIWRTKVKRPGLRLYKTENLYAVIQQEIYDKEVLGIGEGQVSGKASGQSSGCKAGKRKPDKKRSDDGRKN